MVPPFPRRIVETRPFPERRQFDPFVYRGSGDLTVVEASPSPVNIESGQKPEGNQVSPIGASTSMMPPTPPDGNTASDPAAQNAAPAAGNLPLQPPAPTPSQGGNLQAYLRANNSATNAYLAPFNNTQYLLLYLNDKNEEHSIQGLDRMTLDQWFWTHPKLNTKLNQAFLDLKQIATNIIQPENKQLKRDDILYYRSPNDGDGHVYRVGAETFVLELGSTNVKNIAKESLENFQKLGNLGDWKQMLDSLPEDRNDWEKAARQAAIQRYELFNYVPDLRNRHKHRHQHNNRHQNNNRHKHCHNQRDFHHQAMIFPQYQYFHHQSNNDADQIRRSQSSLRPTTHAARPRAAPPRVRARRAPRPRALPKKDDAILALVGVDSDALVQRALAFVRAAAVPRVHVGIVAFVDDAPRHFAPGRQRGRRPPRVAQTAQRVRNSGRTVALKHSSGDEVRLALAHARAHVNARHLVRALRSPPKRPAPSLVALCAPGTADRPPFPALRRSPRSAAIPRALGDPRRSPPARLFDLLLLVAARPLASSPPPEATTRARTRARALVGLRVPVASPRSRCVRPARDAALPADASAGRRAGRDARGARVHRAPPTPWNVELIAKYGSVDAGRVALRQA